MTSRDGRVVTHHFFRRTARASERRLTRDALEAASRTSGKFAVPEYKVVRAERGPFRWYVVVK